MNRKIVLILLLAVLGAGAVIVLGRGQAREGAASAKADYYCPMHPTYRSDRPGDCPICNMRLVKADAPAEEAMQAHAQHEPVREPAQPSARPAEALYVCPMHPEVTSDEPGECPKCGMFLEKQEPKALFLCPMHPEVTSDEPGECPKCGMNLVKQDPGLTAEMKGICVLHNCPMEKDGKPCPMLVVTKAGEKVTCPVCGTHVAGAAQPGAGKVLYWTDPMNPDHKSDKPGKSHDGRDLVPVYAESGAAQAEASGPPEGYAAVLISPQKRQFIGVTTERAQRRAIAKTIRTVGRIANDPELYQAQQEYLQALHAFQRAQEGSIPEVTERAQRLEESARLRLRRLGLSEELIDDLSEAGAPDQSLLLPGAGGRVWLYASVYEYELPLVRVGQKVDVSVPAIPGKGFEGEIKAIDPVLDAATRSARLRAILTDPEGILKPEMYVDVSIEVASQNVLAVPQGAVFDTGARQIVFVDKGEGLFEPRDVVLGLKAEGAYEIKSGVREGEAVVTSGNFLIDSESRLKAALQGMAPSSSGQAGGHQHGQ